MLFYQDYYMKVEDPKSPENHSVPLTNEELKNIPFYKYRLRNRQKN